MSRNLTLLLIYLFGILLAGYAAEDKECEVLDVQVTPNETYSSFTYTITYKDPSCTNKGKLKQTLMECNTTIDRGGIRDGEGNVNNCHEGMWMVTVNENVNSTCFSCPGFNMKPKITFFFRYNLLNITLQDVHPAVKSWYFTIYKTTVEADFKTCQAHHGLRHIKEVFQDTHLEANITVSHITLKRSFDPHACYCFVMAPISNIDLHPPNMLFSSSTCKPGPPFREDGVSSIEHLPMPIWEKAGWGVLMGVLLCLMVMAFVAFCSPVFLGKILRLKQPIVKEDPFERIPLSCDSQVLLLYAPDIADSQDLKNMKNNLLTSFTVYDLFDRPNHNQLADQCGWTEEVLLPTSGVKKVVVESVGLHEKIASLLQSNNETSMDVTLPKKPVHDKTAENLFTFALRTIIASLQHDYSSVFVVRFTDEVKDAVSSSLVQMRRYKFPDHFSELSKDLKKAKCMNVC